MKLFRNLHKLDKNIVRKYIDSEVQLLKETAEFALDLMDLMITVEGDTASRTQVLSQNQMLEQTNETLQVEIEQRKRVQEDSRRHPHRRAQRCSSKSPRPARWRF